MWELTEAVAHSLHKCMCRKMPWNKKKAPTRPPGRQRHKRNQDITGGKKLRRPRKRGHYFLPTCDKELLSTVLQRHPRQKIFTDLRRRNQRSNRNRFASHCAWWLFGTFARQRLRAFARTHCPALTLSRAKLASLDRAAPTRRLNIEVDGSND